VYFIYHDDTVFARHGAIGDILAELTDIVYPAIRSAVDLEDIETGSRDNLLARLALATRVRGRPLITVQRPRQNPRRRCLTHTARSRKYVRMSDAIIGYRLAECLGDVLLPNDIIEDQRTILAGKNEVTHYGNRGSEGRFSMNAGTGGERNDSIRTRHACD